MKPVWALPLLTFLAGTLFGALTLGDLAAPPPAPDAVDGAPWPRTDPARSLGVQVDHLQSDAAAAADVAPLETAAEQPASVAEAAPPDARIESALAAWRSTEARIAALQTRIANLEQTLAQRDRETPPEGPKKPRTSDERRQALVDAGVEPGLAEDILWRESRLELDRLTLRDLAVREGWMGSDRYREELNQLSADDRSLREEIGDTAWDRYLYGTGEENRVAVSAVIPGSAAEVAGLQAGDHVLSYGEGRVFGFSELRDATTEGESGEMVAVRVQRGGGILDIWVPRGPLGIRMEMKRGEPVPQ